MPFIRKIHTYLCQGGTFNYDNAADIVIEKFDSMEDSRSSGDFYTKSMNFPPEIRIDLNKALRQRGYDPDIPPLSNFLRYENEAERDCSLSILEIEEMIKKNMIEAKTGEGDIQMVFKGINFAAAEDSDAIDDTGTMTFKVKGEGYSNSPTATIDFTIIDND
ncbi:MAG: hypothetical protein ISN28_10200 [Ectothiorhodospiraceae bacterium AqS1]|nr:hypothetical protein [Ectothiorhodospiraceae bacterium AqS1]